MFLPGGPGIPQPRTGLSLGQGGTQQMPSSGPAETLPPSVHTHPAEALSPALSPGEWESSAGPSAMSLSPQRNSSHGTRFKAARLPLWPAKGDMWQGELGIGGSSLVWGPSLPGTSAHTT